MASLTNCLRMVLFLLRVTLGRWVPVRRSLMVLFLLPVTLGRWVPALRSHIRWSVYKHNLILFGVMIPGDRILKLEPGNVT
jgi:hypothetical protein